MTGVWVAVGFLAVTVLALAVILIRRRPGSDLARELPTLRESTRLLSDQVSQLAQLVATQLGMLSAQVSDQLASTAQLLQKQEGHPVLYLPCHSPEASPKAISERTSYPWV